MQAVETETAAPELQHPPRPVRARLARLLGLARPESTRLAVGTLFLVIGSGTLLGYPQAIRLILDEALSSKNLAVIDHAALLMGGIFLAQGISVGVRYYLFTVAGERIVTRLRAQLFSHLLEQEIGFFDQRRTGELLNRLSSDTGVIQNTVSVNISMLLRSVATALGGLGLLAYTSPRLTILMLTIVPAVVGAAGYFGRHIRRLSREAQDALARAGEVAEETLSGVRTVRTFAREGAEGGRYHAAVDAALGVARRRIRFVAVFSGAVSFVGYGAISVVLWYGGRLVVEDTMSVGDLTSFILYTLIVAFSLGTLGSLWTDFMRATGAAERVFDLLDRTPAVDNRAGAVLQDWDADVRFDTVSFAYPARPESEVLHRVSFEMRPGQLVALVGPSGSGKSTIAALTARLYDPRSGRILLGGRDLQSLNPSWLREQIGTVSQEPVLFSTSIRENILYGRPDASTDEVEAAARAANADDFIKSFSDGYETRVGERGVQLSGGQKQRIAIARAVLKNPRILILDEATSSLDAESEYQVKEALQRLMQGRTTLVIAHRLSTVMGADTVLVLHRGQVVERGDHGSLMENEDGLYRRLVERQFMEAP